MTLTIGLGNARTRGGPAILGAPLGRARRRNHYSASGALTIGALPDGDYTVSAVIMHDGIIIATITRVLRRAAGR